MKLRHTVPLLLCALTLLLAPACQARVASASDRPTPGPVANPLAMLPQPEPVRREITLLAVGDLMVHDTQYLAAFDGETYDFSGNFAQVADDIGGADFAIGNLETVFGGAELGYSNYPRFNTPDAFGVALRDVGFDFLTTANNHSMDKDLPGLYRTLDLLDEWGIAHTGTYRSEEEREQVVICEVEGIRIALVSFTFSTNGIPVPEDSAWAVSWIEEDHVIEKLAAARAAEPDWIIALPHIGDEYVTEPHPAYVHWLDLMVANGADMVLASHPHILQRMELRRVTGVDGEMREGLVIYSLGNFISSQRIEPREISIMLKARVVQENGVTRLDEVSFIPVWVQFTDSTGARNIRVLSVYDALMSLDGENELLLRSWDAERLLRADREIAALYLGEASGELQREYLFYTAADTADSQE